MTARFLVLMIGPNKSGDSQAHFGTNRFLSRLTSKTIHVEVRIHIQRKNSSDRNDCADMEKAGMLGIRVMGEVRWPTPIG